jgi:exonuclease VII small subunit
MKKELSSKVEKLDSLIAYFEESGNEFDLDEGIKKYEEAILIVKDLKDSLKAYELKIKELDAKYKDEEVI